MNDAIETLREVSSDLGAAVAELDAYEYFCGLELSKDFCKRINRAANRIETVIYLLEEQIPYVD